MNWIWADVLPESRVALYPHILATSDSAAGAQFHDWVAPREQPQALAALCERLSSFRSPEMMASAVSALHDYDIHEQPQAFEFLGRVLADTNVDVNARALALGKLQFQIGDSFDWSRLLAGDDPLAVFAAQNESLWTSLPTRPEKDQIAIFESCISSPHEEVRQKAASLLPLDHAATLGLFRKALEDSSAVVRKAAIVRLGAATRADLGPVYVELLTHKDSRLRAAAVERLPKFASVECIEPLTKMLDDPDVDVRESALGALRKVKSALEERKEWQDLAGKLKQGKT